MQQPETRPSLIARLQGSPNEPGWREFVEAYEPFLRNLVERHGVARSDVQDVTHQPAVTRDLALIKVKAGPEKRAEINGLAEIFRAHIVDVAPDSVIVEITGTEDKIEGMIELLRPVGVVEMVRTGQVSMTRGANSGIRRMPGANGNHMHEYEMAQMAP